MNNKRILYIHQYFVTPEQPGGNRSYWFAKKLVEEGYSVTMLTSKADQKESIKTIYIDGIKVIYIRNAYSNNMSIAQRFLSFFRFMSKATIIALKQKGTDLIFSTSTPLSVGVPALILKWVKNVPYIFEVRDLWPEVPIQMGALKNPIIRKAAIKLEKLIYKKSEHIIALSPGMKEGILKCNIQNTKVTTIPNMSKINHFYVREKNKEIIKKFNLNENDFFVIHFGTMGIANGLDYILDAAKVLKLDGNTRIKFLFAGKGGVETKLKERCKNENLDNIFFLGNFALNEISEIVNIADCSIVTFKNIPILKTNSPNKLFDSLSAQKPVIVNSDGWTRKMVEDNYCGAYVNPDAPKELANLLIKWSQSEEEVLKMGINARALAENKYDKSILASEFTSLINKYFNKFLYLKSQ